MALTTNTPGVYIQEIQTLPASVAQVETAIPAFIGYTTKAGASSAPTRIKSLVEYEEKFGGPYKSVNITVTGTGTGSAATAIAINKNNILFEAMQMYFANGGGPCYIISVGTAAGTAADNTLFTPALSLLAKEDEPTLIVMPELMSVATAANCYSVIKTALAQCNTLKDRFTIIDVHGDSISSLRTEVGTQYLKYGAAYYPQLKTTLSYKEDAIYFTGGDYDGKTLQEAKSDALLDNATGITASTFLLGIEESLATIMKDVVITLPPSSSMAGIYASVDRDRGVWKAPANVSLSYVSEPSIKVSHEDQESMNIDTTAGKSVNAIRTFAGKGVLVWGARTLAGNDNEWKYVPVRRLFIMIEESIMKATESVVFEPNDRNTWVRVRAMIENYLTGLWRQGALSGAKPEQAFFVNVGLGETMTSDDVLNGKLIIEIGIAAVRPAEFIILNFSHKLQES